MRSTLLALAVLAAPLALVGAGADAPSARPEPSVTPDRALAPVVATCTPDLEATRAPTLLDVAPLGSQVEPSAPLTLRFDGDVDSALREGLLTFEPPVAGTPRWLDARTVELRPARWRAGRVQRVRVGRPGGPSVDWAFRTRVPPPAAVTPGEGGRVVLTFDDGPHDRRQASRLLDLLRELEVQAIFFPNGRWAGTHREWVARAVREGHRVCNHTFSHINLTDAWIDEPRIRFEIERGASDGECKLFRPPLLGWDARVERVARELGYSPFLWDIDPRDWEGAPADDIVNRVLGQVRPDAIVLLHMHADETFRALPPLVEGLRAAGYVPTFGPAERVGQGASLRPSPIAAELSERWSRPMDGPPLELAGADEP